MKVKVIKAYTDRLENIVRFPGDVVSLSSTRAKELLESGYVECEVKSDMPQKPDYGSMAYAELKAAAKAAGISTAGKKADLVAALESL